MSAVAQPVPPPGRAGSIPASAGIGLRAEHYREAALAAPRVTWLEVHSENYFGEGGLALRTLDAMRASYPVSLHGVGLSLGSTDPLNGRHLSRLKRLITRIEPGLVSEHLSWSSNGGRYSNDLIPLPYTEESLDHMVDRVRRVQDFLGVRLLLENPSSYLQYRHSAMPEWEFLVETARRSGAGILLDVNNVYVSCCNHGWDAHHYLRSIPGALVEELHLAGHTHQLVAGAEIRIDTHDRPPCAAVWALFAETIAAMGPKPTLIEWDARLPPLAELVAEADKAEAYLTEVRHADAA